MTAIKAPCLVAALVTVGWIGSVAGVARDQPPPTSTGALRVQPTPEQIARGRDLFDGTIPLAQGGPACASCHAAATVPAAGGTMGPDLTGVTRLMGREGLASALQTLYFPTMYPLFAAHPLTPDEQASIGAFLDSTEGQTSRATRTTFEMGTTAIILCVIFFAGVGWLGRSRVSSVRHSRLDRLTRQAAGKTRHTSGKGATA